VPDGSVVCEKFNPKMRGSFSPVPPIVQQRKDRLRVENGPLVIGLAGESFRNPVIAGTSVPMADRA
jgi:hypothetical protein